MKPHDLRLEPRTDPTEIYRYRDGLYAVDLLTAAITGLDFFTWLSKNPSNRPTICRSLQIKERPTEVMLALFTAMHLLENRSGLFHLTERAREHLTSESPWNLAPYYASLKERPVCKDMLAVLHTGKPANWASLKNEKEWAKAMEGEAFANQFTAAMDCRGVFLGQAMAKRLNLKNYRHLLDIAGGSGIYACSLAAHHPHLKATVLEKPPVDRVAGNCIAKRGLAARVSVIVRDMFEEPFPADCDLHLLSNVLHDWDEPLVRKLLAKSFASLLPGGMLLIHDAHINADKTGPFPVAAYSALLMNITEGKCYSITEMEGYLDEAGFRGMKFTRTAADRSVISARKAR